MDFVEKIVETVSSSHGGRQREETITSYGYAAPPPGGGGHAPLPFPWVARWDERDQRWFYVNEQTGERTWENPAYRYGPPPPQQQQPYGYGQQEFRQEAPAYYQQAQPARKNHNLAYGAAGLAAGLVGGAVLMHEGEKIHDRWEDDKYRVEEGVEEFPENAARWTGEKVGEFESIPERVEGDWDRAEYRAETRFENAISNVEDVPEELAGWAGRKVGDVERFDDNVEDAYEEGRYEGRNDDRDDW